MPPHRHLTRRGLTEGAALCGKVFELDGEPDALATRSSCGRNRALDVAHQRSVGEEGLFGQSGLVFDALRIAGNDGGIFRCDTAQHSGRKDGQDPRRPHFKDGRERASLSVVK